MHIGNKGVWLALPCASFQACLLRVKLDFGVVVARKRRTSSEGVESWPTTKRQKIR